MKFDAIVVGAGTAGCLAAKTMAEAGLNVCLVERSELNRIGEKICGDVLAEHHLRAVGLEKPNKGEVEREIEGVRVHSPDMKTIFTIKRKWFAGYMLNRRLFGQWLLKKAIDSGATLLDSMQCLEPIVEDGFVVGVSAKNLRTGERARLNGKVVLDASGFSAVIRRKLPNAMGVEKDVANEDVEVCYREVRQLSFETEGAGYCDIYLSQAVAPGGYTWLFFKEEAKVNVGLGVCMKKGFPNPKGQFYKYVLREKLFNGSRLLNGGTWYVPTRRPLDNMVGNGVAVVGDAACATNPVHGGGIGPSMLSGYMAGKTVVEAIEKGDVGKGSLWAYNCRYMGLYGVKQAGLDVFRMLLLGCSDDDINYGMKHRLLTEDEILSVSLGEELRLNVMEAVKRFFKGLKRARFLSKLTFAVNMMKRVKAHYAYYPKTPEGFEAWRKGREALFLEARSRLL